MDQLFLIVAVGAAIAGFVQGLSGFGFALAAMALWSWTLAPQLAGPLVVFCSLIGQLLAVGALKRGFSWPRVLPFLAGGVIGVPIGVALLRVVDPLVFRAAVGALLLAWCSAMLLARRLPRVQGGGRLADGASGLAGGILGGIGGLSGPAPTLWVTLRGWERDASRAVIQAFNLAMHAVTLSTYFATGTVPREALPLFLVAAPAMLLPTIAGTLLYKRISDVLFRKLVLGLLAASGAAILLTTLPQLL